MNATRFIGYAVLGVLFAAGCGEKKPVVQNTTKKAASAAQVTLQNISDNPAYYTAREITPRAVAVKDLDGVIRPVLVQLFGGAKIIEEKGQSTARDGEVILNRYTYVTKQLLSEQDIRDLHTALLAAHFSTSPRLGSKPTTTRNFGMMSLFKRTSAGQYSLEIRAVFSKQTLEVISYQLGSKYDRLM